MTRATVGKVFTYSGQSLDILNLRPEQVHLYDIAHSLANQCRYNGATEVFYSVAEHSVHISRHLPYRHALTGLLHDAAEAYVGDLSVPLKKLLPTFERYERDVWRVIAERYELPTTLPEEVVRADQQIVANEMRVLLRECEPLPAPYDQPLPDLRIEGWTPEEAEREFILQFKLLTRYRTIEP